MSAFALSEVPTVAKMNQKTVFIGSSAPGSPQDGQLWLDTSTNPYTLKMYHSAAAVWRMVDIAVNKVKMPAAVAADYSTPSGSATASSENSDPAATPWLNINATVILDYSLSSALNQRVAHKLTDAQVGANKFRRVRFELKKTGTPTGILTVNLRKVLDDTIIRQVGTLDVSTLTTTYADVDFTLSSVEDTTVDLRVSAEYSGGDGANYVSVKVHNGDIGIGNVSRYFSGAWTDDGGRDTDIQLFDNASPATYAASNAKDNNTGTYWQPTPISEASAYIYFDLSSILIVSGCRIYWLATGEIPGSFNIDVSEDAVTWTNVKAITTAQTANAWNEYSWNAKLARYVRIQVVSYGSATTIKVAELNYYNTADQKVIAKHGHGDVM